MKVFGWLADTDGCGFYRLQLPLGELAARGHETAANGTMSAEWRETADVIVAQRTCLPAPSVLWQVMAKEKRRALVYELDDDLFTINTLHNPHARFFGQPHIRQNMRDNMRVADLVTVSTEPLADVVRKINPNVVVLPNYVHEAVLDIPVPTRRLAPDDLFLVGWGGSATHTMDWGHAKAGVAALMRDEPNARMRFLGTAFTAGLPVNRVETFEWTKDMNTHYQRVVKFDVGLAPLVHTTFNRSKSGLKAVEYAALGVPAVCSDVPAYRGVVRHGETGILVPRERDWAPALHRLAADPAERVAMGQQARELAKEWTIQRQAHRWEEAYRSLL